MYAQLTSTHLAHTFIYYRYSSHVSVHGGTVAVRNFTSFSRSETFVSGVAPPTAVTHTVHFTDIHSRRDSATVITQLKQSPPGTHSVYL